MWVQLALLAALVVVAVAVAASLSPRETFFWEGIDRKSARENFSPDVPGTCCAPPDRAALATIGALAATRY